MKTKLYVIIAIVMLGVLIPLIAHGKSQREARKELGQMNVQYHRKNLSRSGPF
jgi:hypothetical protein